MNRKIVFYLNFVILLLFSLTAKQCKAEAARIWIVDKEGEGDFRSIQEAINTVNPGDTVKVLSGVFSEHLMVKKSVNLVGEDSDSCIIDGNGTGNVVTVKADSACLRGFTIRRSGNYKTGILVEGSKTCIIEENIISGNYNGVYLNNSEEISVTDNLVDDNIWGIRLQDSRSSMVKYNILSNNHRRGLHVDSSDENTFEENSLTNNVEGFYLKFSSGNLLRNNSMTENTYSFGVLGSELKDFIQDIDASNRIDGKPIYYLVNQHNKQVPLNGSYVAVVNSTDITVKDLNLTQQQEGLLMAYTNNSTIENVHISHARCGFHLISCRGAKVIDNTVCGNAKGIRLDNSIQNLIKRNIIKDNHEGLFLDNSNQNIFSENTLIENIRGIFVYYSTHNSIHHNNFIDNEKQVFIAPAKILILNTWQSEGEGNFWSDHAGVDWNEDGISDTSYLVNNNNRDNHPLMGLFSVFMVASDEKTERISVVCNSTVSNFNFNLEDEVISFDVAGKNGTRGFCRVTIPHILLNGPYEVLVDGSPPATLKELESSNSTHTVLHFTYVHSTHEVTIVPECLLTLLLIFITATLTITILWRRSNPQKQSDKILTYRT